MEIEFSKMSGAGNDFIVIDNRLDLFPVAGRRALIARMCARRISVGADGVLLLEQRKHAAQDFSMRYYNADGGEAAMCGNGGRCIALFAYRRGIAQKSMHFFTPAGVYGAEILHDASTVRLDMVAPSGIRTDATIEVIGKKMVVGVAHTGVPHVVLWTDSVEQEDVVHIGRAVRYNKEFAPEGINVNFVQVLSRSHMRIRTYERGVENETLACGTGTVAAAVLAVLRNAVSFPVKVTTQGKDVLTVYGTVCNGTVADVKLEGPACITYKGVFS